MIAYALSPTLIQMLFSCASLLICLTVSRTFTPSGCLKCNISALMFPSFSSQQRKTFETTPPRNLPWHGISLKSSAMSRAERWPKRSTQTRTSNAPPKRGKEYGRCLTQPQEPPSQNAAREEREFAHSSSKCTIVFVHGLRMYTQLYCMYTLYIYGAVLCQYR